MSKIWIVVICLVSLNAAFSGGVLRIIIPYLSDLSHFSIQEGELAFDDSSSRLKVYKSGAFHNLVPTLNEELPAMTGKTNHTLVVNSTEDGVEWSELPQTVFVKDVRSAGSVGGGFSSGAWRIRTLNTLEGDFDWIDLASNQFTLQPGKYIGSFHAPAYRVNRHKALLYNVTDGLVETYGTSSFAGATYKAQVESKGFFILELSQETSFQIWHRCETTYSPRGFGVESNYGSEIYTQIKITKIK